MRGAPLLREALGGPNAAPHAGGRGKRHQGRLEVLDLSTLGVTDWRGILAAPYVARLVLLARTLVPSETGGPPTGGYPLVLDFDH